MHPIRDKKRMVAAVMTSMTGKRKLEATNASGDSKDHAESDLESMASRMMEAVRNDNPMKFQSTLKQFIEACIDENSDEESEEMEY